MKVIILDDKMCRVTDLDPEKVVDPVTIEDLETGEHTLSLGYPVSEPGINIFRATNGREAWEACELDKAAITDTGEVVLAVERPSAEAKQTIDTQAEWEAGTITNLVAADGKLRLQVDYTTAAGQQVFTSSGTFTVPAGVKTVKVLVVGGGGGGGGWEGGGGGGGGVVYNSAYAVTPGANIAVTVGGGGSGKIHENTSGADSKFGSITAKGGGRGGGYDLVTPASGGSGGGGAGSLTTANRTGADGTAGQGNKGGNGISAAPRSGGGGGGAGAAGSNGTSGTGGKGGNGKYYGDIFGTSVGASGYFGGGGGGWGYNTGGAGGQGGGGAGRGGTGTGTSGTTNTGGGGGAGQDYNGGNGGSGVVIVKWAAVTVYKTSGSWISPALSLDAITEAAGSLLTATINVPDGTSAKIYAGLADDDESEPSTWAEQAPGQPLTVIAPGNDYSDQYARLKIEMETVDASVTPEAEFLSMKITQDLAFYGSGIIVLPPLDLAVVHHIARVAVSIETENEAGQSVTPELSLDGGETWQEYEIEYGREAAGLYTLTRLKLETTDAGASPRLKSVEESIYTAADAAQLEGGNTIIIPDPDGDLIPFVIREAGLSARGEITRTARCEHLYYELADGPIRSYALTNQTPATAITAALVGTRWQTGNIDAALAALVKDFQAIHLNPLEFLRLIEKEFQARLKFRVTVDGAGITGYLVDLEEIEDTFSGKRFEFGHDLQDMSICVDHSNIKTALVGTALGEEVDPITGDPLPLTFKAAEWSKAAGDPADKPLGQDWVGNEDARKLYGIYNPATGERLHRFGRYESEAETPETLLAATWLIGTRYHFAPRVTVEGDVADLERAKIVDIKTGNLVPLDHEKIRLGQITHVIARHKGLLAAVDVKITRIERHLKRPDRTRITWGDPIPIDSDFVLDIKRKAEWRDKMRRKLDRGRGPATVTVAHETTSAAPWYARYIVREGVMLNDVIAEILALLPAGGGHIVFMEGVYPYDGDIVIDRDNVHIKGQGEGTRFVLKPETAGTVLGLTAVARTGIEIADLSMDGDKENQAEESTHHGITLLNCQDFKTSGLTVQGYRGRGASLESCGKGLVEGCISRDNDASGVKISGGEEIAIRSCTLIGNNYNLYAENSANLVITGNNARHSYSHGMYFEGVNSSVISDNLCNETVYRSASFLIHGMVLHGCSGNTITDNVCNDNSGDGIWLSGGCQDSTISGNQCNNNYIGGIWLSGARRCIIANNTCCNNGTEFGCGIDLWGGNDSVVQNNACTDNKGYGVRVDAFGDGHFITNNDCRNNKDGGLLNLGTNTITTPGNRT